MLDLIREIGQTLSHNKLRTALTGIAVAWGIFMLIVLLGVGRGVFNAANANFDLESSRSITVYSGVTTLPHKGYKEGRYIQLNAKDIASTAGASADVSNSVAIISVDTAVVQTMREFITGGISGVYPEFRSFERADILYGRYINPLDIKQKRKTMVINDENAKILFGDASKAVGQKVESMGLSWTVVGVYSHNWRRTSYVPFSTLMAVKSDGDKIDALNVMLSPINTIEEAQKAETDVRQVLAGDHSFAPEDQSAVSVWNRFESYLSQQTGQQILTYAIWAIGLLTLLSGIIGVSNIMFVSVRERTHEIGVRRAIGAKPRSILGQVIAESVAITALFGYIGVFTGMGVTEIINSLFGKSDFMKNPTIDLSIAMEVTLLLIVVGALAGLAPALKATKVRPVEALRDE